MSESGAHATLRDHTKTGTEMSDDNTDNVGSLQSEEVPFETASEDARLSLDEAVRSLWDAYTAAESAARRTLSDAEADLQTRLSDLDTQGAELVRKENRLEATFEEANRLLNAADHQHRVADDRIRDADKTTARAAETLAEAMDHADRLIAQATERSLEIEESAHRSTSEASESGASIIAVAEEDAAAIIAQAQQRAEKIVNDAESTAEKTMDGARIYKELQLAELESKETASRERLRDLMQSIESTLQPRAEEPEIDLRHDDSALMPDEFVVADDADASGVKAGDADVSEDLESDDPSTSVVDEAVRRAFDQWASEGSAS